MSKNISQIKSNIAHSFLTTFALTYFPSPAFNTGSSLMTYPCTLHSLFSGQHIFTLSPHVQHIPPSITHGHNLKIVIPIVSFPPLNKIAYPELPPFGTHYQLPF